MGSLLSDGTNLIIFIVLFAILVFVHELGHFMVAKRLKIPVLEFGFGYPPQLVKFWHSAGWIEIQGKHIVVPRTFKWPEGLKVGSPVIYKTEMKNGQDTLTALQIVDDESQSVSLHSPVQAYDPGTVYTLNALPLGGFVRMMGEEDPNVPGGFASAKPSVRAPVLLAGVTMNLILAFVVFTIAAVFSPPAVPVQTTQLQVVATNSPAAEVGLRVNDLVVAVNGQNVQNDFPTMKQLLDKNAGQTVTLTVVRAGKTLDPISVVPRKNPPAGQGALGIQLTSWVGLQVASVQPGSPAEQAGIRPGDALVFLASQTSIGLQDQDELVQYTTKHPGYKITVHVLRDNKLLDPITVQIPATVNATTAALGMDMHMPVWNAPLNAASTMWDVVSSVPRVFTMLFAGSLPPNSFVGVIGIAQATGEIAQRGGALLLLRWLGLLSLNLAVVNLIPFPALDGGRLIFVLLEWIRGGKKIDPQKEGMVHLVGIMVLLGLMVLISFFDVQRLISGQSIFPGP